MTEFPTADEVLIAAEYACGFRPVVGDPGLFESSIMRASATVFGQDAYPSVWDKAAALLHSLVTTQSLADGNKRTGWAGCWLLLGLNGYSVSSTLDPDAAEQFVLAIAANELTWEQIADRLPEFAASTEQESGYRYEDERGKEAKMPDSETIFSSITPPAREWTVGTNSQHRVYLFEVEEAAETDHPRYVIVHGYNVMASDGFMDEISRAYPDAPILYRSQLGIHHDGPADGKGGWRVRFPGSTRGSIHVPFEDLLSAGITLT